MFLVTSSISGHDMVVDFLVSKSCQTLCDPMDCSPRAPPSRGFSRQEYWSGFHSISLVQGIFLTQRLNLSLLHGQEDSLLLLAMVEAQQISDLRISKRMKQQPNYDGHWKAGGQGRLRCSLKKPLIAGVGGSPPPPSGSHPQSAAWQSRGSEIRGFCPKWASPTVFTSSSAWAWPRALRAARGA